MPCLLVRPTDKEVLECIKNREDFHIDGRRQKDSVRQVEELLESKGYTVRVKTKGREASLLLVPLWAINVSLQLGHTLVTWDPDWVIYKNAFGSKIEVKYFDKDC